MLYGEPKFRVLRISGAQRQRSCWHICTPVGLGFVAGISPVKVYSLYSEVLLKLSAGLLRASGNMTYLISLKTELACDPQKTAVWLFVDDECPHGSRVQFRS